jgi:hypothetical protein
MVEPRSRPARAPVGGHDCQIQSLRMSDWLRAVRDEHTTCSAKTSGPTRMDGVQGGGERLHKGVQRVVDLVPKVVMDRAVLPLDLGDHRTDGGGQTGRPLVGAAG